MKLEELYELFEKNINEPNREKTLNAMANHPKGNILAQCVFERADAPVFLAAKNHLLPKNDGDEYGPFDSLLDAAHCKRLLRIMASEDYVISLLKDEFDQRYEREPDSLSDIVRILADRREIKEESSIPKATFEMDAYYPTVKIGSEWIISDTMINGPDACNKYDEPQTDGLELYVYKISRSSGILLKELHLPLSFIGLPNLLLEPFLIMFDGTDSFEIHNLLEPTAAPMTIKRDSEVIGDMDFGLWAGSKYDSDIRVNGKPPESVLFPVVYMPSTTSVCVECAKIGPSSIEILWKQTFDFPEEYEADMIFLDRDNYVLLIIDRGDTHVFHINLSKQKINQYFLAASEFFSFGLFKDRLVMAHYGYTTDENNRQVMSFGFLTEKEEENFQVACFFKNGDHEDISIGKDEILHFRDLHTEDTTIKKVSIDHLLEFLDDKEQEKDFQTIEIMGVAVTKPLIQIESLSADETVKERAQKEFELIDRSNIGRASRNKIEIFI